ncbi:MAG: peptidoglycan recognition family protein [Parafilimonas sp.]
MNIVNISSPNFSSGRKGFTPITIVIHIMEGTLAGTDSWFKNPASQVSAHYGIGKAGEVHQYVKETDTAWHAGRVSSPSWKLIKTSGGAFINPNYYTVGIEHEGNEETEWSDAMYNASAEMIQAISSRWNIPLDRDHVIGHHEIYAVKTCPGNKVDLNKLIALAAGNSIPQPVDANTIVKILQKGKATTISNLNMRKEPNSNMAPLAQAASGLQLAFDGFTTQGQSINGNSKWFFTDEGNWFWSGGVK